VKKTAPASTKHQSMLITKKETQKMQDSQYELALHFEDFFEFSVDKEGRRTCSMNVEAMSLILAEGKQTKIVS
jgi:hypothetical protein